MNWIKNLSELQFKKRGSKISVMDLFRGLSVAIAKPVSKILTANQVTFLRTLVLAPLAAFFFSQSYSYLNLLTGVFLLWFNNFLDLVDGDVARLRNELSPHGAKFDTDLDKIGTAIIFFGFVWGAFSQLPQAWVWAAGFVALIGIYMNNYYILGANLEREISKKHLKRTLVNLVILPEYLIIYGALLGMLWLFVPIIAVIINLRWIGLYWRIYWQEKKTLGPKAKEEPKKKKK